MLRDTQNPLTEAQIKTYTQMLLKGVDYMHDHNIMHRVSFEKYLLIFLHHFKLIRYYIKFLLLV